MLAMVTKPNPTVRPLTVLVHAQLATLDISMSLTSALLRLQSLTVRLTPMQRVVLHVKLIITLQPMFAPLTRSQAVKPSLTLRPAPRAKMSTI